MLDLKITKQRLKDHLYYSKWLYLVAAAIALVIFSLIYQIAEPVVPKGLKVDIAVIGFSVDETEKTVWEDDILSILPEDQQEVNIYSLALPTDDSSNGFAVYQILTAKMTAKEDDILILPKDLYLSFASQGAFLAVDDIVSRYELPEGLDLDEYKVAVTDEQTAQEPHLYGFPIDNISGFRDMGIDPEGKVMTILVYTENYTNVLKAADYIMNKTESASD